MAIPESLPLLVSKIELPDMVSQKEDIVSPIICGGSERLPEKPKVIMVRRSLSKGNAKVFTFFRQPLRITGSPLKGNAYSERDTFQCDSTIGLNLSNNVVWAILYWGQHFWESSGANGIPGGRDLHVQCLVRALVVIDRTPPAVVPVVT